MKLLKTMSLFVLLMIAGTAMTSCIVLTESHKDHGQHRGWFKQKHHGKHKVYIIKTAQHQVPVSTISITQKP